jgi:hypothetical protein
MGFPAQPAGSGGGGAGVEGAGQGQGRGLQHKTMLQASGTGAGRRCRPQAAGSRPASPRTAAARVAEGLEPGRRPHARCARLHRHTRPHGAARQRAPRLLEAHPVLHLLVVHELRLHHVLLLHEHLGLGHVWGQAHLGGRHARERAGVAALRAGAGGVSGAGQVQRGACERGAGVQQRSTRRRLACHAGCGSASGAAQGMGRAAPPRPAAPGPPTCCCLGCCSPASCWYCMKAPGTWAAAPAPPGRPELLGPLGRGLMLKPPAGRGAGAGGGCEGGARGQGPGL